jgi:fructose-1,6-bisphosphatase/inositol monophosphatase family enzyme
MCLVAGGMADGFYFNCRDQRKKMRIVDIAASALILREAGGEVYGIDGGILDMKFSLNDRVNFLAVGEPSMKEMMK